MVSGAVLLLLGSPFLHADIHLEVDATPENVVRLPDLYFDRDAPPKPMAANEAAFTEGIVSCQTNSDARISVRNAKKNKPCTANIQVEKVAVTVRNQIRINLPTWPLGGTEWEQKNWKILQAHEEGHVTIYREIFNLVAHQTAQKVFGKCPSAFNVSVPFCNDAELQAQMNRELDIFLDALTAEAVSKISDACRKTGEAYDQATSHGRQGSNGEPPSVENQAKAAEEAIRNFERQFQ